MSDVSVRDAARREIADGLLAKHSAEADLELDAPTSIQDIRDRLARCTHGCRCDDGDHENAVHDLASSDVPVLLAAFDAALSTIQKVRERHRPSGVFDECEHEIDAEFPYEEPADGKHTYVEEFGWSCNRLHDICIECCTYNGYQTEDCASSHDHGEGKPICPTIRILDGGE